MPRLLAPLVSLARVLVLLAPSLVLGCVAAQPVETAMPEPPRAPGNERPAYVLSDLEARVLTEVNRVRATQGRTRLTTDPALAAIARAHSQDMVERAYFAHASPEGHRAGTRARQASYRFSALGENLYRGRFYDTVNRIRRNGRAWTVYLWYTPDEFAEAVVEGWMDSPGHRDNMLSRAYDAAGIGIATGPDDRVLVTLNLSAR